VIAGRVVLRSWWAATTYFGACLLVGSCVMGLLISAFTTADVVNVNDLTLALQLLGLPIMAGAVVAWRIAVRVDGDDVLVVNPLRTHRFARRDLRTVELGRENYIVGAGRSLPMLELHVRGLDAPIQVVAAIRVSEASREAARERLLATRDGKAA
jgi:hypothetical protein